MMYINKRGTYVKKIIEIVKERKFKYICFFWIIISMQFVIGNNLQTKGHSIRNVTELIKTLIQILCFSIIFIIIHYYCLKLYRVIKTQSNNKKIYANDVKQTFIKKYRWAIYFLIIIICWIPTLLAFYPCLVIMMEHIK